MKSIAHKDYCDLALGLLKARVNIVVSIFVFDPIGKVIYHFPIYDIIDLGS